MRALLVLIGVLAMPFLAAGQEGPPPKFDNRPRSIDAPPPADSKAPISLDAAAIAQATREAAAAVLVHKFAEALVACDRGLHLDARNLYLLYYKSAALRERGVATWNVGDRNKDENVKNEARADWTAVIGIVNQALPSVPPTPAYAEMRYRFVHEKAEVQYLLAHTSGIARTDALASLDAALAAAQDPGRPSPPAGGVEALNRQNEMAKLKLDKANLLVDNAAAADAPQARTLFREVLDVNPLEFNAMVGMSMECIIAIDWSASAAKMNQSAQVCIQEASAFRAQMPPSDPRSARLQEIIDALKQLDQSDRPRPSTKH